MKRYEVIVVPEVEDQIREQVIFIARHSVDNALAWEQRLRDAIDSIGILPGYSVDIERTKRMGTEVRKMVFEKTYIVHYLVTESRKIVEIINFCHGARLPSHDKR